MLALLLRLGAGVMASVLVSASLAVLVPLSAEAATELPQTFSPRPAGSDAARITSPPEDVSGATSAHVAEAPSRLTSSLAAAQAAGANIVTFSEFAVGTRITDQYLGQGVLFGSPDTAAAPFIARDGANPTSPVLSGSPLFNGNISGAFVIPGSRTPTSVRSVTVDVGYIDDPGSVQLLAYTSSGVDVVSADGFGINRLTSSAGDIYAFEVVQSAVEAAGFAIDNVSFTAGTEPVSGLAGGAPAPSESYGANNPAIPLKVCGIRFGGDPVNTLTGNFTETYTDVEVLGAGPELSMQRTYNSLAAGQSGWFGNGWSSSWNSRVEVAEDKATVVFGNGSTIQFSKTPLGWFAAPRVMATLRVAADGTATVVLSRRTKMSFDSAGQLTGVTDPNARRITIERPDPDTLVAHDAADRKVTLTFADGRVASAVDPSGARTEYQYDQTGNLVQVVGPHERSTTYAYDAGRLISVTTPTGGTVTNTYDQTGRVLSQTDLRGESTTFTYDAETTSYVDPDGVKTRLAYDDGLLARASYAVGTPVEASWTFE